MVMLVHLEYHHNWRGAALTTFEAFRRTDDIHTSERKIAPSRCQTRGKDDSTCATRTGRDLFHDCLLASCPLAIPKQDCLASGFHRTVERWPPSSGCLNQVTPDRQAWDANDGSRSLL